MMKSRISKYQVIIWFLLFAIVIGCNAEDNEHTIYLGTPIGFYELHGPVKKVEYVAEYVKSNDGEWEKAGGDSIIPYAVLFNEEGYLTAWATTWEQEELADDGMPYDAFRRIYNDDGTPAFDKIFNDKKDQYDISSYVKFIVEDNEWYTYKQKSLRAWEAWNKKNENDFVLVTLAHLQTATLEGAIKKIQTEDYRDTLFFYRNDGTIQRIEYSGYEIHFDENGKWLKTYDHREGGEYTRISDTEAEFRYPSGMGTTIISYTFILDGYGNWIERYKHSINTAKDVITVRKTIREIEYYVQ